MLEMLVDEALAFGGVDVGAADVEDAQLWVVFADEDQCAVGDLSLIEVC